MKRLLMLASIVAGVALVAPPVGAVDSRVFKMNAQNGSNENGTVTLTPLGGYTRVAVKLANAPVDVPQPVHFHTGSCANLGKVVIPLTILLDGKSTTLVKKPIDQLVGAGLAVNGHKSRAEAGVYIACADIQ